MSFGVQLRSESAAWSDLLAVAKAVDAGRWHSLWIYDHFMPPMDWMDESGDCLEAWTLLGGLAVATARVRIGVLVSGNTYRNPALVAKMAATIDQISGGRLEVGLGAGWHVREHAAYGWVLPSLRERSDRLEEACAVLKALFGADQPVTFTGTYYRLDQAPFAPRCVQTPHPPLTIGGDGERRTLRTVARYGDAMNVTGTPATARRKIAVLHRHCAEAGRDPATILKGVTIPVALQDDPAKAERLREFYGAALTPEERARDLAVGSAAHICEVLRRYAEAGVDRVIMQVPNNPEIYRRLDDEVVAAFR
jgi:F420-dependent oxidoreductase-like protein